MPFSQVHFHKYNKFCRDTIAFLKSVTYKSNFSQTFEWQEIMRRKTNKSYDKTAARNDPRNNKLDCKIDPGKPCLKQ